MDNGPWGPRKYVELGTGGQLSYGDFWERERQARLRRFGVILPAFHEQLETQNGNTVVPAALFFKVPAVAMGEARRLIRTLDERRRGLSMVRDAIAARRQPLEDELSARGVDITSTTEYMPAIFVRAKASTLLDLARHPDLTLVTANEGSTPRATGSDPIPAVAPARIGDARIWEGFNCDGYLGEGIPLGIIESNQRFALNETHNWFSQLTPDSGTGERVNYQAAPIACPSGDPVMDCQDVEATGDPVGNMVCRDVGRGPECIPPHPTSVASIASWYEPGPDVALGAARSTLWVANKGLQQPEAEEDWIACHADALADAYVWLTDNGVRVVNESWQCNEELTGFPDDAEREGIVEDYYAWLADTVIAKAAGNLGAEGRACPFSLNSICVGFSDLDGNLFTTSTKNPDPATDREEPDIITYGYFASVAKHDDHQDIGSAHGTSMAAPTVAATAALCQEKTEAHGAYFSGLVFRVMTMLSGFHRGSASMGSQGIRYSTPGLGTDYRDGAGRFDAALVSRECDDDTKEGSGDPGDSGVIELDPSESMDAPPANDYEQPSEELLAKTWHEEPDGRIYWDGELEEGDRIRGVISWNTCPPLSTPAAPYEVTTDFDLGLWNKNTEEWVMMSQSFFDSNEGLDWIIQEEGHYELWILHEPGAAICEQNRVGWGFWIQ